MTEATTEATTGAHLELVAAAIDGDSTAPDEQRRSTGDRRKVQRRRQIDPTTCERDYTDEEIEFMRAMDEYKRNSGRMFPTCSEILEVVRALGYVRRDALTPPEACSDFIGPAAANELSDDKSSDNESSDHNTWNESANSVPALTIIMPDASVLEPTDLID